MSKIYLIFAPDDDFEIWRKLEKRRQAVPSHLNFFSMPLEDKHLDILQNIEFAILSVYRNDPSVRDVDAILALEALTSYFHQKNRGNIAETPSDLSDKPDRIFTAVLEVLEPGGEQSEKQPERPRFSRALRATTREDIYLACLRKIEKSAKRWHKLKGERGYLDFVINYLP